MSSDPIRATLHYHQATKHSARSVRSSPHRLDFSNLPSPYKVYTSLEAIPLPQDLPALDTPALAALSPSGERPAAEQIPDLLSLAQVLHLSAGITRVIRGHPFRAAACTGALYHIDLYLACRDLPGLAAGVYHFGVHDHSLRRLRAGDPCAAFADAVAEEPSAAHAPALLVATSTFWRNAWKYQARTYRHAFWDLGTILANLLAVAAARGLAARLLIGFVDGIVNRILGIDPEKEAALALVALGHTAAAVPVPAPAMEPLNLPIAPYSRYEVDYPLIHTAHAASSFETPAQVAAWHTASVPDEPPAAEGSSSPTEDRDGSSPQDGLTRVILRRGSSRRFRPSPISPEQLSRVLEAAAAPIPADFLDGHTASLGRIYLILNSVDGLSAGSYLYHRADRSLEPLRPGDFRTQAGHLALDQDLASDAAVNLYFLADLEAIIGRFGDRGYRAAQLEAALRGGRAYLAAYAQRIGATGLTFYDDEVVSFFSPSAAGLSVMFLTAIGHPAR